MVSAESVNCEHISSVVSAVQVHRDLVPASGTEALGTADKPWASVHAVNAQFDTFNTLSGSINADVTGDVMTTTSIRVPVPVEATELARFEGTLFVNALGEDLSITAGTFDVGVDGAPYAQYMQVLETTSSASALIPSLDGSGEYTCTCWLYVPNTSGEIIIIGHRWPAFAGTQLTTTGTELKAFFPGNDGKYVQASYTPDTWMHVAIGVKDGLPYLWINGGEATTRGGTGGTGL